VQHVQDGNTDLDGIARAIEEAQKVAVDHGDQSPDHS
jgi:hypothetical protein